MATAGTRLSSIRHRAQYDEVKDAVNLRITWVARRVVPLTTIARVGWVINPGFAIHYAPGCAAYLTAIRLYHKRTRGVKVLKMTRAGP